MSRQITWKSWGMLVTLGLVWGSTFLVIEIALRGMTPGWVAAARVIFAALLMTLIWGARGWALFHQRPTRRDAIRLVIVALLSSTIPFTLLAWGQQSVTSAYAGVTMATVIFMVLPLAHSTVPGERMRLRAFVGFLIGFVGVVLLVGGQVFSSTGAEFETLGRLAVLGTAACYAVGSVMMRWLPPVDAIGLASILMIVGAVAILPLAFALDGPPPMPDAKTFVALAALGLIPTAGANFLRVVLIRSAGPTFMGLVNYIVPVISTVLGAWILGETLPSTLLVALAIILVGMAISQWEALTRVVSRLRS